MLGLNHNRGGRVNQHQETEELLKCSLWPLRLHQDTDLDVIQLLIAVGF